MVTHMYIDYSFGKSTAFSLAWINLANAERAPYCKLTSVFLCVIRFPNSRRICPRNCRVFFSLFRNPAEMSHTCRGTISLHGALIHTVDACTFVVSNGGTQTFHIKAATEVERQQWVTALELAKAKAIQAMESGLYDEITIFSTPIY